MKKIFKPISLFLMALILLTGCSPELKTEKQILKFVKNEYGVSATVVSKETREDAIEYTLKDNNKDITFNATSYIQPAYWDGAHLYDTEQTICDYYSALTEEIRPGIQKIEEKYGVRFEQAHTQLINRMIFPADDIQEIDFENALSAINELNTLYDFKKEPGVDVYISLESGLTTDYCYPYKEKGAVTGLRNSVEDFYEENNIPQQLLIDVVEYINKKENVNCFIDSTQIQSDYDYDKKEYFDIVVFVVIDDEAQFKKEYWLSHQDYNNDFAEGELKNIENYIYQEIEHAY